MSSGFYNLQDNRLLYAEESVLGTTPVLLKEFHTIYTYPVRGWYYFESREEAKTFFNYVDYEPLPMKEP